MNAQLISSEAKEISISITETDIGILYIIQHELLKASPAKSTVEAFRSSC